MSWSQGKMGVSAYNLGHAAKWQEATVNKNGAWVDGSSETF